MQTERTTRPQRPTATRKLFCQDGAPLELFAEVDSPEQYVEDCAQMGEELPHGTLVHAYELVHVGSYRVHNKPRLEPIGADRGSPA